MQTFAKIKRVLASFCAKSLTLVGRLMYNVLISSRVILCRICRKPLSGVTALEVFSNEGKVFDRFGGDADNNARRL